jgi:hypothetical protein
MKIASSVTAAEIVENLYADMENGNLTNTHGERISAYHAFLWDEDGNCIAVQATEEKDGLPEGEYFYSVHVVDNITGKDCELYCTDELSKESLLVLVSDIIKTALDDVVCNV